MNSAVESDVPFVDQDDWRVAARLARRRNQWAVKARRAGDDGSARKHQSMADWLIARARMWRAEWING
jgi:hypothetical protein